MNLDISSGMTPAQSLIFYQTIYNGIKSFRSSWTVFGNPGADIQESFLRVGTNGAADTLVVIENFARNLPVSPRPAYLKDYAGDRFGGILHSANTSFDYSLAFTEFRFRNISYVYLTDDVLDPDQGLFNPYDQLPTNWEAQVSLLRTANAQ
jgi:hypothetical protein